MSALTVSNKSAFLRAPSVFLLLLWLSACATQSTPSSTTRPASGPAPEVIPPGYVRSYVVFGKRYYILANSDGFRESGLASWYGPKFDGRPTANGETFDMHQMTAAHKSLPLPTYVRVVNRQNQREVIVRVNDRGPFIGKRVIDLSYAAAVALDMVGPGTSPVDIYAINSPAVPAITTLQSNAQPGLPVDSQPYIQIGAFADIVNARKLAGQLEQSGFSDVIIQEFTLDDRILQRVKIGPLSSPAAAQIILDKLSTIGLSNARVVSH